MVVLVLLNGLEGRLLEESDYSMDGLFSPGSRADKSSGFVCKLARNCAA